MALEDLIGSIYQQNLQLPIAYGGLYNQAYSPYYNYLGNQAQSQAQLGSSYMGQMGSLGGASMGLYGNLAGLQSQMYQSELPVQVEEQKYNSLAPVLSGLLGQYQGFGGLPSIAPISIKYNRPDVMSGYQSAVDRAYGGVQGAYGQASQAARSYDNEFRGAFADMMDRMPRMPQMNQAKPAPSQMTQARPTLPQSGPPAAPGGMLSAANPLPGKYFPPNMASQKYR